MRAAVLTAALVASLAALLAWDWHLAARAVEEDGPIEWIQVALLAACALLSLRGSLAADAERRAPDVILALLFIGIALGEADVDGRLFGTHLMKTRFFMSQRIWWGYKVAWGVILAAGVLALLAYTLRHRREILVTARRLAAEAWGRLFLAGALVFAAAQLLERPLLTAFGFPPNFLEEVLELIAAIYFFFGMLERSRPTREPPG